MTHLYETSAAAHNQCDPRVCLESQDWDRWGEIAVGSWAVWAQPFQLAIEQTLWADAVHLESFGFDRRRVSLMSYWQLSWGPIVKTESPEHCSVPAGLIILGTVMLSVNLKSLLNFTKGQLLFVVRESSFPHLAALSLLTRCTSSNQSNILWNPTSSSSRSVWELLFSIKSVRKVTALNTQFFFCGPVSPPSYKVSYRSCWLNNSELIHFHCQRMTLQVWFPLKNDFCESLSDDSQEIQRIFENFYAIKVNLHFTKPISPTAELHIKSPIQYNKTRLLISHFHC